jgi:hypothetical protein
MARVMGRTAEWSRKAKAKAKLERRAERRRDHPEAAARAVEEELAGITRDSLSARQKSDLISKYGLQRYLQIPMHAQPRDGSGRFRAR